LVYSEIFSMAFSHDGKTIASGRADGRIDLWDVRQRKWKNTSQPAHLRGVYGLAFSPDDSQLATVSEDRSILIRDVKSLNATPRQLKGLAEQFLSVAFTNDGLLATGTINGKVVLWNLNNYPRIGAILPEVTNKPTSLAFLQDNKTLIYSSDDKLVYWDVVRMKKTSEITARQGGISMIFSTPDGSALVTVGNDNSIQPWDSITRKPNTSPLVQPSKETVFSGAISPDGHTLAVAFKINEGETKVQLFDVKDGSPKQKFTTQQEVHALALSPNGKMLAIAEFDSRISVIDLTTQQRFELDHMNVFSLAFSPDGKLLGSAGKDSEIRLWDVKSHQNTRKLEAHRGPVKSIEFSHDGKLLVSASMDKTFILWNVETGKQYIAPVEAHFVSVTSAKFSPDGNWLVTSAEDGSIIEWDLSKSNWENRACELAGRNFTRGEEGEWKQFFGEQDYHITCPIALIYEADQSALSGDRSRAEQLFSEIVRLLTETENWEASNSACWFGSIHRFEKIVQPACEQTIKVAPEAFKNYYRDSRGLTRALIGNKAGAIEDFTAALEPMKEFMESGFVEKEYIERREKWIDALKAKAGQNPFDEKLLRSLRTE
jgi:WD40 repeat protein